MPELILYNKARRALAEVRSIDEVKEIHDQMTAYQVYAKQAKDTEMLEAATDIKLRAARRAGEILHQMRESGERAKSSREFGKRTLSDLGVTKLQSHHWQKLSALAQEDFERRVAEIKKQTLHAVESTQEERSAEKKERRAAHEEALAHQIRGLPNKKFGLILADPEWKFGVWSEEGQDRAAANHYATSTLADIKARDVQSIAADDCLLALWSTSPMLPQALEVMTHWGFTYRSHCVWLKPRVGTGYWFRSVHELLLIGVKGDVPAPAPGTQWESAFDAEPAEEGAHSSKPVEVYKLLESYFPSLPKIELNARAKREGWEIWGAEAPLSLDGIAE